MDWQNLNQQPLSGPPTSGTHWVERQLAAQAGIMQQGGHGKLFMDAMLKLFTFRQQNRGGS